jgi:toluene monooxygenase system ferredoxin subunit
MAFQRVASLDELWIGEMMTFRLEGARIVLLRLDDAVCAYEDRCAHLGVPLSEGRLEAGTLTCSAHHYEYEAGTGKGINPRGLCLQRFEVRVEEGEIFVDPARASKGCP